MLTTYLFVDVVTSVLKNLGIRMQQKSFGEKNTVHNFPFITPNDVFVCREIFNVSEIFFKTSIHIREFLRAI